MQRAVRAGGNTPGQMVQCAARRTAAAKSRPGAGVQQRHDHNDRHNSGCSAHSPPTPCVAWLVQKVVKRTCRVSVSSTRGLGGLTSVRGRLRPCATFSSLKIEWRHLRSRGRCCRRTAPFIEGGGFLPTGPLGVDRPPIPHYGRRARAAGIAHRVACPAPTETANDDRGSSRTDAPTRSSQTSAVA